MMMSPDKMAKKSMVVGSIGVIFYIISMVLLWTESGPIFDAFDHKDFFFGGSGLLLIAVWIKLGAIYHKGEMK
jgi:hypothetical protein